MGCAVFERLPSSAAVGAFLEGVLRAATPPKYVITDRGVQFTAAAFRRWCRRRGIRQAPDLVNRRAVSSLMPVPAMPGPSPCRLPRRHCGNSC
jgi:transposase InsO family protein